MFIDETRLVVTSGSGGNGALSFRREKYVQEGGPDGGDGGSGGHIIFAVRHNVKTFAHLQNKHKFVAANGQNGSKARKHGANAANLVIIVPPSTLVRDYQTKTILLELGDKEADFVFLRGGRGGLGNSHFKSSTNRSPSKTTKGKAGLTREILLEMSLIADIGLVGFPNAGKSSLLKYLTNANPKVAAYPFTTRTPHLGVLNLADDELVLADIPGIIEGASAGQGLGLRFLKHLSRTKALAFCLDMQNYQQDSYSLLLSELNSYNQQFLTKKRLLIATKMDCPEAEDNLNKFKTTYPNEEVVAVSVQNGYNVANLKAALAKLGKD
ncbi:MAG: GTPase ObgE [Spirochaetaceae bacterium]|nr:GTPase ObgE [Spirochaetaceae bacterium]